MVEMHPRNTLTEERTHAVNQDSLEPRVCFVIPTYNEADNITMLLVRLTELYPDPSITFLVVDDESPDGTGRLVREFAASDGRVRLLEGKKRGLGAAYVRGITHALDALGAEVVVQMDADFSHDPADAGRLLARVASDADVAIGSRYVAGGSIDQSWSWRRRQLSLWGNRLARWIAGLKGVRDCTAGFKAIRAAALQAAKVQEITVLGYAFQVALLHRLLHAGARVVEEPIHFRDRERGVTKLGLESLLEFAYHIWWLRLTSHRTLIKFCLTGASGVLVNLGSFQLLTALGLHRYLASPIAIELSIISNFLINNYWTFADRTMIGSKRIRGLKFNAVSLLSLAVSYGTFVLLSLLLPNVPPVWLQGMAIVPAALVNYFLNSYWTFRDSGND